MSLVLLILDIQKDYIGEHARLPVAKHQVEPMLEKVNTMIQKVSNLGFSVVYIGNEFETKHFVGNFLRRHSAMMGSKGAELDERLLKVNNVYFSKSRADAFSNPELLEYLRKNEIKEVVIVGLFTEGCVTATALGAIRNNYITTVLQDAVASSSDKKRRKSLNKLAIIFISIEQLDKKTKNVDVKRSHNEMT